MAYGAAFSPAPTGVPCSLPSAVYETLLSPPPAVPCQDDWGNVYQTLESLGTNILTVSEQLISGISAQNISALSADIQMDITGEMNEIMLAGTGNTSPPYYQGGHYNLDITLQQIQVDVGNNAAQLIRDFTTVALLGSHDGVRRNAPNQPGYWLHSRFDKSGAGISFHFDRYSPYSVPGIIGHPVYDVGYGSSRAHPCLDPAWRH